LCSSALSFSAPRLVMGMVAMVFNRQKVAGTEPRWRADLSPVDK